MAVGNEKVACVITWVCFHTHQLNIGALLSPSGFTLTLFGQGTDPLFPYKEEKVVLAELQSALGLQGLPGAHILGSGISEIPFWFRTLLLRLYFSAFKNPPCSLSTAISPFLIMLFKMAKLMKPILCLRPLYTHYNIDVAFLNHTYTTDLENLMPWGRRKSIKRMKSPFHWEFVPWHRQLDCKAGKIPLALTCLASPSQCLTPQGMGLGWWGKHRTCTFSHWPGVLVFIPSVFSFRASCALGGGNGTQTPSGSTASSPVR